MFKADLASQVSEARHRVHESKWEVFLFCRKHIGHESDLPRILSNRISEFLEKESCYEHTVWQSNRYLTLLDFAPPARCYLETTDGVMAQTTWHLNRKGRDESPMKERAIIGLGDIE